MTVEDVQPHVSRCYLIFITALIFRSLKQITIEESLGVGKKHRIIARCPCDSTALCSAKSSISASYHTDFLLLVSRRTRLMLQMLL